MFNPEQRRFPETLSQLESMIDAGIWSKSWSSIRKVKNKHYQVLLLRLAQTVWNMALIDNNEDEGSEDNKQPSAEVIIARILIGLENPDKYTQEELHLENFEKILFSECVQPGDGFTTHRDLRLVYLWVIKFGNDINIWKFCEPEYPVLIKRDLPVIQKKDSKKLQLAIKIRSAFIDKLQREPEWFDRYKEGTIIISAMLWDGLIDKAAIRALYQALSRPLVRSHAGFWIDLLVNPEQHSKTYIRRFWPQPVTSMFWFRVSGVTSHKNQTVEEVIYHIIGDLLNEKSPKIDYILKGMQQDQSLNITPTLLNVASGKTMTHPIMVEAFHRIQGIGSPYNDVPEIIDDEIDFLEIEQDICDQGDEQEDPLMQLISIPGLEEIRAALTKNNLEEMNKSVRKIAEQANLFPPIIITLASWIMDFSNNKKITTRRWMFGLIGARLVSICDHDDLEKYDEDELETVFGMVLSDARSNSQLRGMRYALRSLYSHIVRENPGYRPAILNKEDRIDVSSRIITHEQYHEAINRLRIPEKPGDTDEYLLVCRVSLILFFRLGLRRRELLYLPLHDIHGRNLIEIIIRAHSERTLKTSNAFRKLELSGFLSEEEISVVKEWLILRRNQETVESKSSYLLWFEGSRSVKISENYIIDRIVNVLREVTGDHKIHVHHLRHSFMTWTTTAILGHAEGDDFNNWSQLPVTQKWLLDFKQVVESFYVNEPINRGLIYLISTMAGHSTPAITFEHYVHGTDQLIGRSIWSACGISPETLGAEGLGLSTRTYFRLKKSGWDKIIDYWATQSVDRWNQGMVSRIPANRNDENTRVPLFETIYEAWKLLKWHSIKEGDIDESLILDANTYSSLIENAKKLKHEGTFRDICPSMPSSEIQIKRIRKFANIIDQWGAKNVDRSLINTLVNLWVTNKQKNRGNIRFKTPFEANQFIELFLSIGFNWDCIHLTWIGSRFNAKSEKEYKKFWREELGLPRKIGMDTASLENDRPLKGTKGYLDVRVVNQKYTRHKKIVTSKEFHWVMSMMAVLDYGSEQCILTN